MSLEDSPPGLDYILETFLSSMESRTSDEWPSTRADLNNALKPFIIYKYQVLPPMLLMFLKVTALAKISSKNGNENSDLHDLSFAFLRENIANFDLERVGEIYEKLKPWFCGFDPHLAYNDELGILACKKIVSVLRSCDDVEYYKCEHGLEWLVEDSQVTVRSSQSTLTNELKRRELLLRIDDKVAWNLDIIITKPRKSWSQWIITGIMIAGLVAGLKELLLKSL